MKPSSFCVAVMATVMLLVCTSFKDAMVTQTLQRRTVASAVYYFWYDENDNFLQFTTINVEIGNLEMEYGVEVDMSPSGGTLIASGYNDGVYPHDQWPAFNLYGHF